MSEYRRQVIAGSLTAILVALILAGGASYLFPLQPPQTSSTVILTPSTTTLVSTTTAASALTQTTSSKTAPATTNTTGGLPPLTGALVTVTVTEAAAATTAVTLTTTVTNIGRLEIRSAYAKSPTQVVVDVKNTGDVDQTITDILVNGNPISTVNGGTSSPHLPIKVAAGASQTINLFFSVPLSPDTIYFVTVLTS